MLEKIKLLDKFVFLRDDERRSTREVLLNDLGVKYNTIDKNQ